MCSACHQRGHIRTSKNCPVKLKASIAESSQLLRENEVLQASQASNVSQTSSIVLTPVGRLAFESTLSPLDALQASFPTASINRPETPVNRPETPANRPDSQTTNLQALNKAQTPILITSSPIVILSPVRMPVRGSISPANASQDTLSTTPIKNPLQVISRAQFTASISPESPRPTFIMPPTIPQPPPIDPSLPPFRMPLPAPPPRPPSPLRPLDPRRPEMRYMRYTAAKESWLIQNPEVVAQNPQVSSHPNEYRKARGWPIYNTTYLAEYKMHLGFDRREPSGKLISKHPNWSGEEITAFIDAEDEMEDRLVEQFDKHSKAGYRLPSLAEYIEATVDEAQELSKRYTLHGYLG
jgi:hypothetical protein